jgi:hypothetical protein
MVGLHACMQHKCVRACVCVHARVFSETVPSFLCMLAPAAAPTALRSTPTARPPSRSRRSTSRRTSSRHCLHKRRGGAASHHHTHAPCATSTHTHTHMQATCWCWPPVLSQHSAASFNQIKVRGAHSGSHGFLRFTSMSHKERRDGHVVNTVARLWYQGSCMASPAPLSTPSVS